MWRGARILFLGLFSATLALSAQEGAYRVVSEESRFTVEVGTAGLFGMFGHEHLVEVRELAGHVDWNAEAPERSQFVLEVDAASLTVIDEDLSEEDRAEVQSDMDTKALELSEHSQIRFESTGVQIESSDGSTYEMKITGSLALRGVTEEVEVPVTVTLSEGRLTAKGEMELQADRWGVPQISVAAGTVKTSNELDLSYEIVTARE